MAINYADTFQKELEQKYERELCTAALGGRNVKFYDAKNVKVPTLTLGGFQDHDRSGGWNRQSLSNTYQILTLSHDRNVEFLVDAMDVDETNQALSAANITDTFASEQEIPELDAYRFSKIYADYVKADEEPDESELSTSNILSVFDTFMEDMDEAGVPSVGRVLYATPATIRLLKSAEDISRNLVINGKDGVIDRSVRSLDEVSIVSVPSARMKTEYDFSDGFEADEDAKQINMILMHPSAVVAPVKRSAVYLFAPGEHTAGDGWLYQNRFFTDLFIIESKIDGIKINADPGTESVVEP